MTKDIEIGCMLDKASAEVLLTYLAQLPKKGRLVETGTGWGHSSKFFSQVLPGWTIYTIDGFGLYGDGRIYKEFSPAEVEKVIFSHPHNVIQILADSKALSWEFPMDILFIDADHTQKGCKADYDNYSPWLKFGGLLVFDDYIQNDNPDNGVKEIVDKITGYEVLYKGMMAIMRKL